MIRKLINKFSVLEIVFISMIATIGIAMKPVIKPLVNIIAGPLFIPGGALAGGLYMMWIVLGAAIVKKRGAASLISIVQAMLIIVLGSFGNHGILSFLTYIVPGLSVDIFLIVTNTKEMNSLVFFVSGLIANLSGTILVNLIFFKLPMIPLILTLSLASLSGGIGGLISYSIYKRLNESGFLKDIT